MPLTLRRMGTQLTHDQADDNWAHEINQTTHGLAIGDAVYRDSATTWAKAQANAVGTLADGVVVHVEDANNYSVATLAGTLFTATAHGLGSSGALLYLSAGTAGLLTTTVPTSGWVQPCGKIIDTNTLLWRPGFVAEEA